MEAEVVDSLWEIGRQEDGYYHNKITVTRSVWQEGQRGVYNLFFDSLEDLVSYFIIEEVGDGLYDLEDRVIVFSYDQPTGPIDRVYAFFHDTPFVAVVGALGDQLTSANLDIDISRKVIGNFDPGFYPPSSITDRGDQETKSNQIPEDSKNITLQDFTDANLQDFNRLISTDLNKKPFGTASPSMTTPDYLKRDNEDQLRQAIPSSQRSNGIYNKTRNANGYPSQDISSIPLQTIRNENSELLFNEYEHLTEDYGEKEPGGIAPRPDFSSKNPIRSRYQRPLPERNLLNIPSFRSWQV